MGQKVIICTATFLPTEAQEITGLTTAAIRDLRRLGYIASSDGKWARFTIQEIATLLAIGALQRRGLKSQFSSRIAKVAAAIITGFAVRQAGAIDDPSGVTLDVKLEVVEKPDSRLAAAAKVPDSVTLFGLLLLPLIADVTNMARGKKPSHRWPRFLIVHGMEEANFRWEDDLTAYYQNRWDIDLSVVLLIDLERLGQRLAARAGKPLVTIKQVDEAQVQHEARVRKTANASPDCMAATLAPRIIGRDARRAKHHQGRRVADRKRVGRHQEQGSG
jgi:hypothetical protein